MESVKKLVRDPRSGAVLNTDLDGLKDYKLQKNKYKEMDQLKQKVQQIDDIKSEIIELKDMLKAIADKL